MSKSAKVKSPVKKKTDKKVTKIVSPLQPVIKTAPIVTVPSTKITDIVVGPDVAFYCCNGAAYYCVKDLYNALRTMDTITFSFHVNDQKNDFCNWIKYVFKFEKLATDLQKAKTAKDAAQILEKAL